MKTWRVWSVWVLLVLAVAGCGGGGKQSAPLAQSPRAGGGASVAATEASDEAPPPAEASAMPATASDRWRSNERVERERPGLGTAWGETRRSATHEVAFVRDSSAPFATLEMRYNDRAGVRAMADRAVERGATRRVRAGGGAVVVSIVDDRGVALEAVRTGRGLLVVGDEGERYSILLENRTSRRIEAVATVDGLDVINGQAGHLENRGYVLMPHASVTIDGFRRSASSVAAFRFARVADSYAAQTSGARNVGVIGVALFSERGDGLFLEDDDDLELRESADPFPADPRYERPPRGR